MGMGGINVRRRVSHVFATGVWISVVGFVVMGVINYLTRRLLVHVLDRSAYGFFYSAFSFSSVVVTIVGGGVGHSVMVLMSKYYSVGDSARARSILGHGVAVTLVTGLLLGLAVWLAGPVLLTRYFGYPSGVWPYALICLSIPLSAVLSNLLGALNVVRDYVARNVIYMGQYLVLYLVSLFGVERHGLVAVTGGLAASHLVMLGVALPYVCVWRKLISLDFLRVRGVARETLHFSAWTTLSATGMLLMANLDTLILTRMAGLERVAIYNVALPIVQIFQVSMIIPLVFAPIATDLWHTGRRDELAAVCRFVVDALTLIGGAVVVFLIPCSNTVIGVLFGGGFEEAAAPLALLGAGMPLFAISQFFMYMLMAIGRPAETGVVSLVSIVISMALNVALIHVWDIRGAALATAISYAGMMLLAHGALTRHMGVRISHRGWRMIVMECAGFGVVGFIAGTRVRGILGSLLVSIGLVVLFLLVNYRRICGLWAEGRGLQAGRDAVIDDKGGGGRK